MCFVASREKRDEQACEKRMLRFNSFITSEKALNLVRKSFDALLGLTAFLENRAETLTKSGFV